MLALACAFHLEKLENWLFSQGKRRLAPLTRGVSLKVSHQPAGRGHQPAGRNEK